MDAGMLAASLEEEVNVSRGTKARFDLAPDAAWRPVKTDGAKRGTSPLSGTADGNVSRLLNERLLYVGVIDGDPGPTILTLLR